MVLDHLEPIALSPRKTWDASNLVLSCKACHDGFCASIEAQYPKDPKAIREAKLRGSGFTSDGRPIW